ncbi:MAG TPA: DUF2914 domain-containing protein [Candidatus Paceibacterota bacterium]|nr:DUF2914 domain-containing protein [Candidatus Paceibacterota bacterium]
MSVRSIKDWKPVTRVRNWYARFERPISSLSLVGGFVFDALTLQRVDMPWENFWVVVHLVIVGTCIILINRQDVDIAEAKDPAQYHFWLVNILQFFFGGLLSTYLVFYFRSTDLLVSWPFIFLLGLAFLANERFKKQYTRLSFQIVLFYLCIFAFAIFLVPVVLRQIGPYIFIISGLVSLACMALFLRLLKHFTAAKVEKNRRVILLSIGLLFVLFNVLYFNDFIPPIPLSLKDSGVYHTIERDPTGDYVLGHEETHWYDFFNLYPDFHASTTDPVYVYSAIFSPPQFDTNIIHKWQYYNAAEKKWIREGNISLLVAGGRDGGFRTYSVKYGLIPGLWRVDVETDSGQTIGTVRFNVVDTPLTTPLETEIK